MREVEYLEQKISEFRTIRASLPNKLSEAKSQTDAAIEKLMADAGILAEVQRLRSELELRQKQSNVRNAVLGGRIEELEAVLDKFHRFPVADGTIMHGIDVSKLDWESRARVMNGDQETIQALGGVLEVEVLDIEEATIIEDSKEDTEE